MKIVEDVKKFLLRFLATGEELHIVDKKNINLPIRSLEVLHGLIFQMIDELIRKLFRGCISHH